MFIMNEAKVLSETKNEIEIVAPGKSDFFIDQRSNVEKNNAPFLYEKRKGDFVFSAKVRPEFKKHYDAGGLFVFDTKKKWIKLEFEMTDLGYPSVVSVVTDGTSDDCNGERLDEHQEIYLQVIRNGDFWWLHYSIDGKKWNMHRYFRLKMKEDIKIGCEAQSPLGKGTRVIFTDYKVRENKIKDMRKGR